MAYFINCNTEQMSIRVVNQSQLSSLKKKAKESEKEKRNIIRIAAKVLKEAAREHKRALEKQAKSEEKAKKKTEKETKRLLEKAALVAEKIQRKAEIEKQKIIEKSEKEKKRLIEKQSKHEISPQALSNLIRTAKRVAAKRPNGFSVRRFVKTYIKRNGRINPYTLEEVEPEYDLAAAIRGIMYETSPSSQQHWFRYGMKKAREQIAPWVFANKELATTNHQYEWKVATKEMTAARRRNKGLWMFMPDGAHALYDWNEEVYGPLPTEELLQAAAVNRKQGARGKKVVRVAN
jgi:hypothetical protein